MSEISKQGRGIIEAARGLDDPMPGDKERIFSLLQASIGQMGGPGAPASPAAETEGVKGGISTRNKILLLAMAGILILGGTISAVMLNYSTNEKTNIVDPNLNPKIVSLTEKKDKDESDIASLNPITEPVEIDTEEKEDKTVKKHRHSNKSKASSTEASDDTPSQGSTLKEELRLLNNAQLARRSGHYTRAMSYLKEHEQRFPSGLLVEEREAARVFTYCDAENLSRAQWVTNRFLSRYPNSPLASKVRSSCVFDKKLEDAGLQ